MGLQKIYYSTVMRTRFYTAPTCFGAVILPSSGTWHQNDFQTHNNKTGHNKHSHVLALIDQDFEGFV